MNLAELDEVNNTGYGSTCAHMIRLYGVIVMKRRKRWSNIQPCAPFLGMVESTLFEQVDGQELTLVCTRLFHRHYFFYFHWIVTLFSLEKFHFVLRTE